MMQTAIEMNMNPPEATSIIADFGSKGYLRPLSLLDTAPTIASDGVLTLEEEIQKHNEDVSPTPKQTVISSFEILKKELKYVVKNCLVKNWDKEGAIPISIESINYALEFISLLPNTVSYPELVPEPSGDLAMVWWKNNYHITLGIDKDGNAAYGATTPNDGKQFGDFAFSYEIPKEFVQLLAEMES